MTILGRRRSQNRVHSSILLLELVPLPRTGSSPLTLIELMQMALTGNSNFQELQALARLFCDITWLSATHNQMKNLRLHFAVWYGKPAGPLSNEADAWADSAKSVV